MSWESCLSLALVGPLSAVAGYTAAAFFTHLIKSFQEWL